MNSELILETCCHVALGVIALSLLLALYRLLRGPTLPDRVVAVDMLSFLVIAYVAVVVVNTRDGAFLDAASTLALITFVSTTAFARYLERLDGRRKEPSRKGAE